MFTLTINNRQLILDADFSVSIVSVNPCWKFDEIPGPLALDVTIPDNDMNRNILGHPGRFAKLAKSNDRKFAKAELRWRGFISIYGTLVITEASNDGYKGYIQSELKTLSDSQLDKLIGDYELGGELTFSNKQNYDPDIDQYCTIRIHNAGFWVDKGESEDYTNSEGEKTTREVLTRKFDDSTNFYVNATDINGVKTTAGAQEVVVVSPYPFVHKLIEQILKENKFFIRNSFIHTDEILKFLCLYTNTSICISTSTFLDSSTINYDFYHGKPATVTTKKIELQVWETTTFQMKKLLPKMSLAELLLSHQNLTNTFFHFSGIDDVDNIDRESLFDLEPFDLSKYRVSKWRPGARENKMLKFKMNHDGDDQEFAENFTDISSREEDKKESVNQYSDLANIENPKIGEIRLVTSEKMWYEYRQETIDDDSVLMWGTLSIDLQDYKYNKTGDGSEDIETKFSTLRMHESGYPIAYQKGNSSQFAQFTENFSPRLMFYNGNNTGGAIATNGLSIEWKSLVTNRYRRTAPFYANALPVEADFRFPGNIFYKVMNEIYKPFLDKDGSFFIKEIQATANNSEYVDAVLSVYKNEDNVFDTTSGTVDGTGEHVGATFTPKFVGMSDSGWPILVTESGLYRPIPVFGEISTASYAKHTCVDYSPADKLLFVGGNNGQLHVLDLSDMNNIRYKTIQIYTGTQEISAVGLVDNNGTKHLLIGRDKQPTEVWALPYLADFDSYASNQAVQSTNFSNGDDCLRGFTFVDGYYYAVTLGGEMFRTNNLASQWSQVFDTHSEYLRVAYTENRIWLVELNEDLMYALRSNPTAYNRFNGLSGTPLQKVRDLQPLTADAILYLTADNTNCIWLVNPAGSVNQNITPSGILNAGGACFDGSKYAYIAVKDNSGYTKIARYNSNLVTPEALWTYLNVPAFFTKLFLY